MINSHLLLWLVIDLIEINCVEVVRVIIKKKINGWLERLLINKTNREYSSITWTQEMKIRSSKKDMDQFLVDCILWSNSDDKSILSLGKKVSELLGNQKLRYCFKMSLLILIHTSNLVCINYGISCFGCKECVKWLFKKFGAINSNIYCKNILSFCKILSAKALFSGFSEKRAPGSYAHAHNIYE